MSLSANRIHFAGTCFSGRRRKARIRATDVAERHLELIRCIGNMPLPRSTRIARGVERMVPEAAHVEIAPEMATSSPAAGATAELLPERPRRQLIFF
jgi:hypothetical protein